MSLFVYMPELTVEAFCLMIFRAEMDKINDQQKNKSAEFASINIQQSFVVVKENMYPYNQHTIW